MKKIKKCIQSILIRSTTYGPKWVLSEMSESELLKELQNGKRYFYRVKVESGSLMNMDLGNIVFDECVLAIDFTGTNLTYSRFTNSNLRTCIFNNTNLNNSIMVGNSLSGTEFKGANIQGITFKENYYLGMELTISHLEDMIVCKKKINELLLADPFLVELTVAV
ncbi:pentapeptide repeat-containing protein [Neobacillus bataviensis]|uniref:pentapeptide repeat-containing protein n=1 Tax=Neobacillus bataviensis TaxID=220685 RepID=UPI001CBE09D7|nr:pentapeptide repeat-containing protein [Neobacillus bataviensis]